MKFVARLMVGGVTGVVAYTLVATQPVLAVSATDASSKLSASPAITEWIVKPGQQLSQKVIVTNQSDQLQPVSVAPQKFVPREAVPAEAADLYDASTWFTVREADFILRPKESREVSLQITTPTTAIPGGHYATIYFHQLTERGLGAPHALVAGRVGVLAFVTVAGKVTKEVKLSEPLQMNGKDSEAKFSVGLRNTGNAHVLPTVRFKILDWRHKEVAKVTAAPGLLLPYTHRNYEASWRPPLAGRFTVIPEITYGNNQAVAAGRLSWWHIPWRWLLPPLIIGPVSWFGIYKKWPRWRRAWRALTQGK